MSNARNWRAVKIETLRDHPETTTEYLRLAWRRYRESGDMGLLLLSLRDTVDAKGGMRKLARETGLNRSGLHRALGPKGNPRFSTLLAVLRFCGLELTATPIESDGHEDAAGGRAVNEL